MSPGPRPRAAPQTAGRRLGALVAAGAAALALCAAAAPAAAQAKPPKKGAAAPAAAAPKPLAESLTGEAMAEYQAGKLLLSNSDPSNALIKFEHAFELSKDPRLLWNVAICYRDQRKYTRMLATLRRLLDEGGPLLTEEDRKDAAEAAKAVAAFVSPVRITASEAGATVLIDGEPVGTAPIEAQQVDVGKHEIRVKKPGFKDFVKEVIVAGASGMDVAATLERDVHEGRLVVIAGAEDLISLDGRAVGRGRWEGVVASGGHTLRVTAQGMTPYQSEVVVKDGEARRVQLSLTPLAQGQVARWLWIAGGAVLVSGAVIGGALLFQPSDRSLPGSINPPGKVQLTFGGAR